VKDELILLHRMNAILQFRSASLHESRRAFGLRIGERDLSGVTLDRMPFDSSFRHFASFSSDLYYAADDPFVDARGEVVDFDPSAGSQVKSTALLQVIHHGDARDLRIDVLDEGNRLRSAGNANAQQSGHRAKAEPGCRPRQTSDVGHEVPSNPFEYLAPVSEPTILGLLDFPSS
jgi:hypothetical protein